MTQTVHILLGNEQDLLDGNLGYGSIILQRIHNFPILFKPNRASFPGLGLWANGYFDLVILSTINLVSTLLCNKKHLLHRPSHKMR